MCLRWSSLWASNSYPVCASNSNSTGYTFPHTVELSDGAKYHHVNVVGCGFSDAPSSIELFVCRCCSLSRVVGSVDTEEDRDDNWLHI